MANIRVHFETFGCQMNKLDSETAAEGLLRAGFEFADGVDDADVVLFNTCSVRGHAEERVYSRIGALKCAKQRRPQLVIGVMGCMAQKDGPLIFRRAPLVDIVCGPRHEADLAALIAEARSGFRVLALDAGRTARVPGTPLPQDIARNLHVIDQPACRDAPVGRLGDVPPAGHLEDVPPARLYANANVRQSPFQAFVAIMLGCNNFCSYCVVPYVRGPEESRPPDDVAAEVERLAQSGSREITLLGQNVDSYQFGLPHLLRRIHDTPGLDRIRFVTSHPKDVSDDLLATMAELPKVCRHLHAPAQSGSNSILHAMNRRYTREHYLGMIERARRIVPGIEIASDFIVGFPGETEDDFQQTADLVRRAEFNQCFIFKYSPRPGTKAAEMPDDVPEAVKKRRNNELLAVQGEISTRRNTQKVGRVMAVLVEGPSKTDACKLSGRTGGNDIAVFAGPASLVGTIVNVRITGSTPLTLFGEIAA